MASIRRVAVMINLSSPLNHHHQVFSGIERYARECGRWQVQINPFPQLALRPGNRGARIDGIVGRLTRPAADEALAAGVPMVNVKPNLRVPGVPNVLLDPDESGRMAARHLLARGLRNFAYMGFTRDETSRRQLAALRGVLGEAGHACSARQVTYLYAQTESKWGRFQEELDHWISGWSPPIGVFAVHDMLCRHVATACLAHGLTVPFDVALVGSYNEQAVCLPSPALSSIDFGFERIGYTAAELLDDLMDGSPAPTGPIRLPPAELIPRQSSDVVAVDDPTVVTALRYIMEHSHKPIGVADVAKNAGTTRRTLLRLFQKHLGRPIDYCISRLRHERVKRVLVESGEPLKIIAKESGFRDSTELCKVFRRLEGMTPGEYRRHRRSR